MIDLYEQKVEKIFNLKISIIHQQDNFLLIKHVIGHVCFVSQRLVFTKLPGT